MAEAIIGGLAIKIASVLAANLLSSLIHEEKELLLNFESDLRRIKKELEMMQAYIKEADQVSEIQGATEAWVNQVRETAYEIEDIIDEFIHLLGNPKKKTYIRLFQKTGRKIKKWDALARNLADIKNQIQQLGETDKRYKIKEPGEGPSCIENAKGIEDIPLFDGMESYKKELIGWLEEERKHMKISVSGMGGLGKTTLVAQVYKSTKNYFHYREWITVSKPTLKTYDEVTKKIKELYRKIDGEGTSKLDATIHQSSRPKRYLIVLDDVWNDNILNDIDELLPQSNCESRIIFTTRDDKVASKVASPRDRVLRLQPLQHDRALELFCRHAFRDETECMCPQELKGSATAIVEKCDGLPQAIVILGDMMHREAMESWTRSASKCLNSMIDSNTKLEKMSKNLMRNFYDLPNYMKNCFLYCSVFPKDYRIKRKRIIRLWIAEGFVEEKGLMEESAEKCLEELVQKNMLQVKRVNHWKREKEYRMHDVVRELAIWISKKQNFCTIYEATSSIAARTRRLSIIKYKNTHQIHLSNISHLRSLLAFSVDFGSNSLTIMADLGFKLLGVLDLQGASIESIPDAMANLFNLRYLSLRGTKVNVFPKSLGKLENLQTLDLLYSNIEELPRGIQLQRLRHLFIIRSVEENGLYEGMQMPNKIWDSKDMQTLRGIVANNEVVQQVGKLTQLKSFAILEVRESDGKELCASIRNMGSLRHLYIQAAGKGEGVLKFKSLYPSGQEIKSRHESPPLLQKLTLKGCLKKCPDWFCSLKNLKVLYLQSSGLTEDPLHSLESLPYLLHLSLRKAYDSGLLHFKKDGFISLKHIWLGDLSKLDEIKIEQGAMPSLQKLSLVRCEGLKMLPQDIELLTNLKQLYLQEMSGVLLERIREHGDDREKINHIKIVVHVVQVDGEWTFEMFEE